MTKNPPLDEPEDPTPSHSPIPADETTSSRAPPPPHPLPLAITDEPAQRDPSQPSQWNPQSDETEADGVEVQSLDLGDGNVVKLDKLGPMIINSDGTLSRIPNWHELHPIERERTVRLLVKKRNLVRLQKLAENNVQGNEAGEEQLTVLEEAEQRR
ncbi:hypothetical protein JCM24511_06723 [Saitozyma sp. JCM 24511]|nr:hypothetical protein JCM24511_06723 [Saitozyma sp. JCM 24511]